MALVLVVAGNAAARVSDPLTEVLALPQASLLVEEDATAVIAHQADRPMVPASTLKLLTALVALDRWGPDHRFHTDFFLSDDGWLLVKGYADPFLVSEEIGLVAAALEARGIDRLSGIATDDGYFAPEVEIAGRSTSDNPYDAPVSPVAANFNTLHVNVDRGRVTSAEPQTPLTPLAISLSRRLDDGRQRINLGRRDLAPRYFAEILAAKLRGRGVEVKAAWREAKVPAGVAPLYRHHNSRDLRTLVVAMLEYSNNFIANHLFLKLGDAGGGRPLTMEAARQAMVAWVDRKFGWRNYRIEEGAGLSRGNRLSARQLLDVVKAFAPYRELLPARGPRVLAKTGTLNGVSCYAGFVLRGGQWVPFGLMINQPAAYGLREQVAERLARERDLARFCRAGAC
jgi:D-alanyl-D-alanine carboxypeptidase/D-alanyl-D-alanine-endopeptidase (penicillin-binding protein 4)